MCAESWLPKATKTHTSCVILTAFPLQQWLHERASMLGYTYIACLLVFHMENYSYYLVICVISLLLQTKVHSYKTKGNIVRCSILRVFRKETEGQKRQIIWF
jgi:hypothetical protein